MPTRREWMRRAVDAAKLSKVEPGRTTVAPKVGVVIVRDGVLLGESFRGATGDGDHAEYGLLKRLTDEDLDGAEVFTTLEPCSRRGEGKQPCVQRLLERSVGTVYIGSYDPNPRIYREGWRILREGGVVLKDFYGDLRAEIVADNIEFLDSFRLSACDAGSGRFDWRSNDGVFIVETSGGSFSTKWSGADATTVYAYRGNGEDGVANARGATEIGQIDDPAALDYSSRVVSVKQGECTVFRTARSFLLVRVDEVCADAGRGADRVEVCISWEARCPPKFEAPPA